MGGPDIMQLLARSLSKWLPHIKKQTYASAARIETPAGTVVVVVAWGATRAGPAGEHQVLFDRRRVLGAAAQKAPAQQRAVKKICRFREDVIAEVLQARGI